MWTSLVGQRTNRQVVLPLSRQFLFACRGQSNTAQTLQPQCISLKQHSKSQVLKIKALLFIQLVAKLI